MYAPKRQAIKIANQSLNHPNYKVGKIQSFKNSLFAGFVCPSVAAMYIGAYIIQPHVILSLSRFRLQQKNAFQKALNNNKHQTTRCPNELPKNHFFPESQNSLFNLTIFKHFSKFSNSNFDQKCYKKQKNRESLTMQFHLHFDDF